VTEDRVLSVYGAARKDPEPGFQKHLLRRQRAAVTWIQAWASKLLLFICVLYTKSRNTKDLVGVEHPPSYNQPIRDAAQNLSDHKFTSLF
jgi:hypothetical protein